MAVRDKSRLDKFKMLLASPSTDLGELASPGGEANGAGGLAHTWVTLTPDLQEGRSDVSSVGAAADFSC